MRRTIRYGLVSLLVLAAATSHAETIRLKDGTVIEGSITHLSDGVYSIRSDALGSLEVDQADIESIRYGPASMPGAAAPQAHAEIVELQRQMMGDGSIMRLIQSLQDDPELQRILADEDIRQALAAGDLGALLANEEFMALLNHPTVKAITGQVTAN
jgi:hypothetical protein